MRHGAIIAIGLLAVVGCQENSAESSREASSKPPAKPETKPRANPMCGDAPCLDVPRGLKGLAFGMDPAAAKAALGDPQDWKEPGEHKIGGPEDPGGFSFDPVEPSDDQYAVAVDGSATIVTTTLGGADARCRLDFDPAGKLAGVSCGVQAQSMGDKSIDRLFDDIVASLSKKHGKPHRQKTREDRRELTMRNKREVFFVRWESPQVTLALEKGESSFVMAARWLRLSNMSVEHARRFDSARKAAKKAARDAEQKRVREAQRAKQEAEKKRREGLKDLDRDLTGAGEAP